MKEIVAALKKRGWSIGTIESLTGGAFAEQLSEIPGVSSVLAGGVITYMTRIKEDVVHVKRTTIEQFGVISAQTAQEMAEQGRMLLNCDLCVSFTGNAGPDPMEGKPVGLVYGAISGPFGTVVLEWHFDGDRMGIRTQCLRAMQKQVSEYLRISANENIQ